MQKRKMRLTKEQIDKMFEARQGREYHLAEEEERYQGRIERYTNQCQQDRDIWVYGIDIQ
jgi:5-formaminoimidazole-4-carboxamide-1-beta-D-ribofuranosyl 5'-monophosphate synthetase